MTIQRTTFMQIRFEKNGVANLNIFSALGKTPVKLRNKQNAIIRISKVGEQFTVYVKIYSEFARATRDIEYFDTFDGAFANASQITTMLIKHGFKAVR